MRRHWKIYCLETCLSLIVMVAMTTITQVTIGHAKDDSIFSKRDFSNAIIFGDSLSEIGNFPESLTFEGDTSDSGFFTNVYVPISNPVNPAEDRILRGTRLQFPPTNGSSALFKLTLPPQLQLCTGAQGCVNREFRSLNWTEYFVYNGVLKGLLAPGADFRPWVIQFNETVLSEVSIQQSVNYAFYSALSGEGCANCDQIALPCTPEGKSLQVSINEAQSQYRDSQSQTDTDENIAKRSVVIVPGLQKQIDMFEADLNSGQVEINDQTLFIIYTGANDLAVAFLKFVDEKSTFAKFLEALTVTVPREIAGKDDQESGVNRLIALGAKNIIVLGQFNLGFTPELQTGANVSGLLAKHAVAAAFNQLFNLYNASLQRRIGDFDSSRVGYVDIQTSIGNSANSFLNGFRRGYFFTIGDRCVVATSQTIQQGEAASCFEKEDVQIPIGFWNDAHLSTQFYQVIAAAVIDKFMTGRAPRRKGFGFLNKFFSKLSPQDLEDLFIRWFRR